MPPEPALVREWLDIVLRDLRCARLSLDVAPPITEDAGFHCQQAVEKSLTAHLTHKDVEFEKSHLIAYLLDLCARQDESFEALREAAIPLTDYAVRYRCPTPDGPPSSEEVSRDLEVSRRVYEFVLDRLPEDARPRAS
ncbi:MAG: HEPN domain-containing protein [Phycisphaerae bacterium]|nr:HEPN domain-containing protein [Phycisphaerae bacterium]